MSRPTLNLIGQRFGRLVVQSQAPTARYSRWRCLCDCGTTCIVSSQMLRQERGTRSCGCLKREANRRNGWAGGRATAARWATPAPEYTGPHPLDAWATPINGGLPLPDAPTPGRERGAPTYTTRSE